MKKLWALRYVLVMLAAFGLAVTLFFQAVTRFPRYVAAGFALLVAALLLQSWRIKIRNDRRGWRMRCVTAGRWAYEEKKEEGWVGIPFEELGDFRESPHIIGVPEPEAWRRFPVWAAERREEIISRVRTELAPPHYVLEKTA